MRNLYAEETEHDADGEAARVAHEYLAPFFRLAEHIIIIKRHEYTQSGEGKHGIEILVEPDEGYAIEQEGDAAQPGGQSVDAVDEVDGIDDEHRNENGEGDADPRRHGMDEQHTVKVGQFHSARHQHNAADYLDEELGTVAHSNKVVGDADEVQHDDGAEGVCQWQRFCAYFLKQLIMSGRDIYRQKQDKGEEHYGLEGHATKAWHYTLVYLTLVRLVEQSPAEGDEQNLRYHDSCEKHAQEEYRQDVDNPN